MVADVGALLGERRVVVVAHPDDETLWCGGLLVRYPGDWTVICCSIPERDPIRAWKFHAACESLGAVGRLMPYRETEIARSLSALDVSTYDCVLTHNADGEYGHPHHRATHRAVEKRSVSTVLVFGARRSGSGEMVVRLSRAEVDRKRAALRCYNHMIGHEGRTARAWNSILAARRRLGYRLHVESYDCHRLR